MTVGDVTPTEVDPRGITNRWARANRTTGTRYLRELRAWPRGRSQLNERPRHRRRDDLPSSFACHARPASAPASRRPARPARSHLTRPSRAPPAISRRARSSDRPGPGRGPCSTPRMGARDVYAGAAISLPAGSGVMEAAFPPPDVILVDALDVRRLSLGAPPRRIVANLPTTWDALLSNGSARSLLRGLTLIFLRGRDADRAPPGRRLRPPQSADAVATAPRRLFDIPPAHSRRRPRLRRRGQLTPRPAPLIPSERRCSKASAAASANAARCCAEPAVARCRARRPARRHRRHPRPRGPRN